MGKWLYFIILTIVFAGVPVLAEQKLTLSEAIDTALAQNRDLGKLALSLQSELLSRDSAAADFAVTVRPGGSASRSDQRSSYHYGVDAIRKFTVGNGIDAGWKRAGLRP